MLARAGPQGSGAARRRRAKSPHRPPPPVPDIWLIFPPAQRVEPIAATAVAVLGPANEVKVDRRELVERGAPRPLPTHHHQRPCDIIEAVPTLVARRRPVSMLE